MGTGLNAQLGMAIESTAGTYEAVDHFFEFTGESLQYNWTPQWTRGLRPDQVSPGSFVAGVHNVSGQISFEMAAEQAILWQWAMGEVVTTGSDPYTHTCTPNTALPTMSIQKGIPGTSTLSYTYVGCKVNSWSISAEANGIPSCQFDLLGENEYNPGHASAVSLASASYPTLTRLSFTHGVFSLDGSEVAIDDITLEGNNNLSTDYKIRSTNPGGPSHRANDFWIYTGTATADYDTDTLYQLYRAETAVACSLVFTSGTTSITVAGNVLLTGETPVVPGPDRIKQPLPFQFVPSTPGGDATSVVVVNGDSTP